MNDDECECCKIVSIILSSSYDSYGDYQKLPENKKKSISERLFDCFIYREKNNKDYGKLGKDYYEKNSFYDIYGYTERNHIIVTYKYDYQCFSAKDKQLLRGSSSSLVKVTMKKIKGIYTVIDYFDAP